MFYRLYRVLLSVCRKGELGVNCIVCEADDIEKTLDIIDNRILSSYLHLDAKVCNMARIIMEEKAV